MTLDILEVDAVIFDLDGTLIDSTAVYFRIIEFAFKRLGLPPVSENAIVDAGKDGEFNWSSLLPTEMLDQKNEIIARVLRVIYEVYPEIFETDVEIIQGADEILKEISAGKMKIGLVTSTSEHDLVYKLYPLKMAGVGELFEVIITTDDVRRRKPAADPLVECGKSLGITSNRCVYVGDTGADIRAGKAAGMKTIGVLTGFGDYESLMKENPDAVIKSVNDLWEMISF